MPTHNLVFPLRDEQDKIAQCIVHKMIAFVETLPLFRPQDLIVAGQHDSIQDRINELPVNLKYIENILGRNAYQYKLVAHPYKSYRNMDSSMYFGFLSKNFLEFQYNRVLHNCGDAMFHMNWIYKLKFVTWMEHINMNSLYFLSCCLAQEVDANAFFEIHTERLFLHSLQNNQNRLHNGFICAMDGLWVSINLVKTTTTKRFYSLHSSCIVTIIKPSYSCNEV